MRSTQKQLKDTQDQLFELMDGSEEKKLAKSEEVSLITSCKIR